MVPGTDVDKVAIVRSGLSEAPVSFFCRAARKTGCMPPSVPVLIGDVFVPRVINSAVWNSSWRCFSFTAVTMSLDISYAGHLATGLNDNGDEFAGAWASNT